MRCNFSPAPPSAPRNLSIIFQDQSVIVVAWLAPSDSGGRNDVVYDVSCFQCDASPDCSYRTPCNGKLEYWPMKFNNPYTHVTVTALQPNTSYFLRVTAENGVSHLYGPSSIRNAEIQFGTKISGADATFIISLSPYPCVSVFPLPLPLPLLSSHSLDLPLSRPPTLLSFYFPALLLFLPSSFPLPFYLCPLFFGHGLSLTFNKTVCL